MTLTDVTPLDLNHEWNRLLKCGGHDRYTKAPRPLSGKMVSNVAGVVSSALSREIKWGLIATNPVTAEQDVADQLVAAGVRGLLNFAPVSLHVPPEVALNSVDVAVQLEQLSFQVNAADVTAKS